jgi:hypothetical protein
MKRILLAIASALLFSATTGCFHHAAQCGSGCANGDCGGLLGVMVGGGGGQIRSAIHQNRGWRHQRPELGPAGPPVGTYAYPYYTLHGPRDFLADDPPSLGN